MSGTNNRTVARTMAADSDLTIVLIPDESKNDKWEYRYKVRKDAFKGVPYFQALLHGGFKEASQAEVTLEEDDPRAMQAWLEILHDMEASVQGVNIRVIWAFLIAAHKYGLDPKLPGARRWFERWLTSYSKGEKAKLRLPFRDTPQLLFPAYAFDSALVFMEVTRYIVYTGCGRIEESRPVQVTEEHHHMHVPDRVIGECQNRRSDPSIVHSLPAWPWYRTR